MNESKLITPASLPAGDVRVFEYGARLDRDCIAVVEDQIFKARRLYNDLVACIRQIVTDLQAFTVERAGPEAAKLQLRIESLTEDFTAAKARDDEPEMKRIAQERRALWPELGAILKSARKNHKQESQERFLSRIGKRATCDTYKLRCAAVADGLGWATANQVLDNALVAFKKSFQLGRAPRFAKADEITQDTLTLQFTAAGGSPAKSLLEGTHNELAIEPRDGCGRRKYGAFRFRLGAASADTKATGTWQYHRPLPDGATVGMARLLRRRIGKDTKWALQLVVKSELPEYEAGAPRKPLVAVHFGWSGDVTGRRVAGISDSGDPGQATVLSLPVSIERDMQRASDMQGERDSERDAVVARIKSEQWSDALLVHPEGDHSEWSNVQRAADALVSIRRLPAQHVAIRKLHRLCRLLREAGAMTDWLEDWRKSDRMRWQFVAHVARGARSTRKQFYRRAAVDLARRYGAIGIEPLDLAAAAKKVDEATGEKSEFARKARSGRVVAAIYEFESAIRWAATKLGSAVLEVNGSTASQCSLCGGEAVADLEQHQVLHCQQCGAELDRKANGAAAAWQFIRDDLETHVEDFWRMRMEEQRERQSRLAEKMAKLVAGRKAARAEALQAVE